MEPGRFSAPPPPPSAELNAAVSAGGAVRTRRPALALAAALALSVAAAAGIFFALGGTFRPDLAEQSLVLGAAWALGFFAPLALALVPPAREVLPRTARAGVAAALCAAALVGLAFALARVVPGRSRVAADGAQLAHATLRCFGFALVVAATPLAVGSLVLRRALPVGARAVGAALGAAGGALGGLVLHLHCAWAEPLHVATGHAGAVVAGAILGALLAPLAIDQRR